MAVAVPMYANYTTRSKLASKIGELGAVKVAAAEYASNNNGSIDYTVANLGALPSGVSVGENGAIELDTSSIVANSSISLVPSIGSGTMSWSCNGAGLTSSQLPSLCQDSGESSQINNGTSGDIGSNLFAGGACEVGFSCYAPNEDVSMSASSEQVSIESYPGARSSIDEGLGEENGFSMSINSENGMLAYVPYDGGMPQDFNSLEDISNSDLSEVSKQNAIEAVNTIKQTAYCDNSNSDSWVC